MRSMMRLRLLIKLCVPLIAAALLSACEGWLVAEPTPVSWEIPTGFPVTPTAQSESPLGSTATRTVITPSATITLTPRFSPTPPLGATGTVSWIMLTATAAGPASVSDPRIDYFVVYPTDAKPGDLISLFWKTSNVSDAAIWRVKEDGSPGRTWKVEPEGQMSLELSTVGRQERFVLSVTNGIRTIEQLAEVTVGCNFTWFFTPEPTSGCPDALPSPTGALMQGFQNGQMFWLQSTNQVIALYSDGNQPAWVSVSNGFTEGMMEEDPALTPPEGMRQPRREFGLVWRDTPGVRERLGWAVGDAAAFTSTIQPAIYGADARGLFFTDPTGAIIQLVPNGEGWLVVSYSSPPPTVAPTP